MIPCKFFSFVNSGRVLAMLCSVDIHFCDAITALLLYKLIFAEICNTKLPHEEHSVRESCHPDPILRIFRVM